jgi:hypothetical protein
MTETSAHSVGKHGGIQCQPRHNKPIWWPHVKTVQLPSQSLEESPDGEKGKCLLCHGSMHKTDHKTCDCPILKNFKLKFEKRSEANNSAWANASRVATNAAGTSPYPVPQPSVLATQPLDISGSASLPSTFTASTDAESYNLGEEFDYKGKCEGAFHSPSDKSNNGVGVYLSPSLSCCHACTKPWAEMGDLPSLSPNVNATLWPHTL